MHKDRLEVLSQLLERKTAIQYKIAASTCRVERAFKSANQELQAILTARSSSSDEVFSIAVSHKIRIKTTHFLTAFTAGPSVADRRHSVILVITSSIDEMQSRRLNW